MRQAKRVAIYARVSTGDQTTDNQLRELRAVAERAGWQVVEEFVDHPRLKLHNDVVIYHCASGSGRGAMSKDFTNDKKVSAEVCEVVRGIPLDEAVVIWTFKPRADLSAGSKGRPVDFRAILTDDLRSAGIDVDATVEYRGERKPRFRFPTWGEETSTSEYAYASNMIFAGVLHRNRLDLASCILGQRGDLWATVSHQQVTEVLDSEVAHSVYQALCRGSCRFVDGNQARPMKAWLIHKHRHRALRDALMEVMPGLQWREWQTKYLRTGVRTRHEREIAAYLATYKGKRLSITALKKALGIDPTAAKNTFARALDNCLADGQEWEREGRSLVPIFDLGFDDEPTGAQQRQSDHDADENRHQLSVSL